MKPSWKLILVGTLLSLAACNGQKPAGNVQIVVDSNLTPAQPTLPGPEGTPRPLARMVGESGIAMDFVLGELLISTNDEAKLNAFLGRWGGRVLSQTEAVEGAPKTYRVQLNPSGAQVEAIPAAAQPKRARPQRAFCDLEPRGGPAVGGGPERGQPGENDRHAQLCDATCRHFRRHYP
jgi:hypothetical protein